ncbi:MAG: hypothetical protein DI539_09575 [Flavobacterium psychrophilum]|nr:MAG: hypothetical protein DI539_09575 [Flavobacterium psychrophilum]
MKQLFLLLLLICSLAFGQDKNISVISLEKVNIVYRGIMNPIKIAVPGAMQYKVEAPGTLEKVDSLGNFNWNVTAVSGLRANVKITATMPDSSIIYEEKEFEIRAIPNRNAYVDSNFEQRTYEMTHEQLKNLNIKTAFQNLFYNYNKAYDKVESFTLFIDGMEHIWIKDDKMTSKVFDLIKNLPLGSEIFVGEIQTYNPDQYHYTRLPHVKIRLIETPVVIDSKPIITSRYNNIIYRGINDTLKIEVPNAKSFTVTAAGLSEMTQDSTYTINVSRIKEDGIYLDFTITNNDNSVINTRELLYIKDITPKKITVNGKSCSNCTLKMTLSELKNALIDIVIDDKEDSYSNTKIWSFIIKLPNGKKLVVDHDTVTDEIFQKLSKLKKKSVIEISVPYYTSSGFTYDPPPLKLMLIN